MTTKYASPLAQAQAKLKAAYNAATVARYALNSASAARKVADNATAQWVEEWPNVAELEGRPTFEGPDRMAVRADGSPYMSGGLQPNNCDIQHPPPPSDETLDRLKAEVVKAEKKEKVARKAEIAARGEHTPASDTGWVVNKPGRIAGTFYAAGDSFDPTTVQSRRLEQMKSVGLVGHG